jgi:hypothetical protein
MLNICEGTLLLVDDKWHVGDVIMPEPGSEDVPFIIPGSLEPVDLESLPITAEHRRWMQARLDQLKDSIPREH